jgi:hypothetical protein
MKDYTDLVADAAAGTLPAVAFYKPEGFYNQHPGYANLTDGDSRIADLVAKLQASPQWNNLVIVITYDEYGGQYGADHVGNYGDGRQGNLAGRCRYPLEVFAAIRQVWPNDKPVSVRISAHDWVEGGITPDDAVAIGRLFKAAGADMIVNSFKELRGALEHL